MKRWALLLGIGILTMSNVGCYMNVWDPNPVVRMQQLIVMSENMRQTQDSGTQSMFLDTPSNLTPMQLNGVVAPPGPGGP